MPKKPVSNAQKYTPEFKARLISRIEQGNETAEAVFKEMKVSPSTGWSWLKKAREGQGAGGPTKGRRTGKGGTKAPAKRDPLEALAVTERPRFRSVPERKAVTSVADLANEEFDPVLNNLDLLAKLVVGTRMRLAQTQLRRKQDIEEFAELAHLLVNRTVNSVD